MILRPVTFLFLLVVVSGDATAWSWQDLWKTPGQQLQDSEASGNYAALLESDSPAWRGAGHYRNEEYAGAAESWAESGSVRDQYNRGTALTRAGDFDAAIDAFDTVLAEQPDHEKATHNRAIAKQLKALQQQQQQQNGQSAEDQQSQQEDSESGENDSESGQGEQDQQSQQQQNQQQDSADEQQSSSQEEQASESEQEQSQSEAQQTQSSEEQQQEQEQEQQAPQESVSAESQEPLSEDQQATEQWLRRIPDDPTGLLRRKLIRSHQNDYPGIRNSASPW